jgi:PGF-pre-PGF domain-containing protein
VDTTPPVVAVSVSTDTAATGFPVRIDCSATDAQSGINYTQLTVTTPTGDVRNLACGSHFADTQPIGTYTVLFIARDLVGGQGNATQTFRILTPTVSAPSAGSGGSGGNGTVSAPSEPEEPVAPVVSATVANIRAEKEISIQIAQQGIAIKNLTIVTKEDIARLGIVVKSFGTTPPAGVTPKENAYQYVQINVENISNAIKTAKISFVVARRWMDDNSIDYNNISLYEFAGEWQKLPTALLSTNDTYASYQANVTGFFVFVIAAEKPAPALEIELPSFEPSGSSYLSVVVMLTLVVIAAAAVFYYRKNLKEILRR